jgi:glucose-6-phosphate isomerase
MLHLDIQGALAKSITPAMGITAQEIAGLRTGTRKYVEEWLKERTKGEHAWSMDPYDRKMIDQVKQMATSMKSEGIKTVLWIGIGGSSLGPQVLLEACTSTASPKFIILDSIDPAALNAQLEGVDWKSTLVVYVSKSGETLEPMAIFSLCLDRQIRKSITEQPLGEIRKLICSNRFNHMSNVD